MVFKSFIVFFVSHVYKLWFPDDVVLIILDFSLEFYQRTAIWRRWGTWTCLAVWIYPHKVFKISCWAAHHCNTSPSSTVTISQRALIQRRQVVVRTWNAHDGSVVGQVWLGKCKSKGTYIIMVVEIITFRQYMHGLHYESSPDYSGHLRPKFSKCP